MCLQLEKSAIYGSLENFKEEKIDSKEVKEELDKLLDQVKEVRRYFVENCEEEWEICIDDEFFRLTNIDRDVECRDLFANYEDEEELWRKTAEFAEVTVQLMQLIGKKISS